MTDNLRNFYNTGRAETRADYGTVSTTFISGVFSWMTMGLALTALTAYYFASNLSLMSLLVTPQGSMSIFGWVVMLAPLAFVMLMSFRLQRLSSVSLKLMFVAFSVIMGISLSFIFLAYTSASIFKTFVVTAGMFGTMAIIGYTTKTDLSRLGPMLMMGVIGLVIASLVNIFTHSATFDYIISFIGVFIFTGLTAYDMQKIKRIGEGGFGEENMAKLKIMGALSLYLDFINLFLFLLRFLGNRR
ncbi:MAG: Bax inhibitor-1/YccA family protein [Chlorobi bacterium]|nr:Bax inhibitor-1/YccA family protein [Chlorobiota bacterium]